MTVTPLRRGPAPDPQVIEELEQMLALARSGELQGLLFAYDGPDLDEVTHNITGTYNDLSMLGALKMIERRILEGDE